MLKLFRYDFSVMGGYKYVQPETGMVFDGNTPFNAQVHQILRHRKANKLPRATWEESFADLEAYTCTRVPGACRDSNLSAARLPAPVVRKCGSCGGRKKK